MSFFHSINRSFRPAAIVIWVVSFLLAVIPLATNMYHDVGPNCWLAPPPSDLPQCQEAESFANSPECGDRQDVTNFLLAMQVLPTWICIIVDACIMYVIYKNTQQLETETKNNIQTSSFFGQAQQQQPHQGEEVEVRGPEGESTISAIRADVSGETGHDENRLPTARSFFGYQSSACQNDDTEQEETPVESVQDKPVKKYSAWRPVWEETAAEGGSSRTFDDFGRIVHSELEPETSATLPKEAVPAGGLSTSKSTRSTKSEFSGANSTHTTRSGKRSRIVAIQGLWYIAGFFFSYAVGSLAVLVYQASGTWIDGLFQAGYFFLALQGAWNFVVFSKGRRQMKTWIGGKVKTLIWGSCCCFRLPTVMFSAISSPAASGVATPQQFATSVSSDPQRKVKISGLNDAGNNQERHIEISGFQNKQPGTNQGREIQISGFNNNINKRSTPVSTSRRSFVSFVSEASTVVHSNKHESNRNDMVSRASALVSVVEDVEATPMEGGEVYSDEASYQPGVEEDEDSLVEEGSLDISC